MYLHVGYHDKHVVNCIYLTFRKRYFICPPNTGIFILAIKVIKQQHFLSLHNRPSTPRNTHTSTASNKTRPPLPITTNTTTATNKKVIISPTTPTLTPIPTPTSTTAVKNNDTNNQLLILQKRVEELEAENKSLRQSNEFLEQTVSDIKSASMDSIEILENMIQSNQNTITELESNLNTEKLKFNQLQQEQNDIKKAGLEAIELTISELESTNRKSEKLIQENESMSKTHHKEIKILLQDINVLENVLQSKMDNEVYLLNSLKKEKHQNARLSLELSKKFGSKANTTTMTDPRWSFIRDTPIQEEEEEDLLDDNILSNCALCEKQGHDLIHCDIIINQRK